MFHGACDTGGSSAAPAPREHRGPGVPGGPRLGRGSSSTWPAGVASGEAGTPPDDFGQYCKPSSLAAWAGAEGLAYRGSAEPAPSAGS